ncbi:type II toxin-antitoxin system HicA family toxin [Longimicrobium terrae]|uniref:Putative RNA binding protein YcfA (HicA-like mRNA interferase family) n=1 Tax=Longimicrobium terrae TaxID=1639882 RepID=A0A841GW25_9BACT|nr:putative RNA binding protein YcfA (HicA-like mRNA interferase family) [Longimicrobium terrae]MBB6069874.1 putative RNA binding protein YcfA (HicA-like mRNA interferase family) [Longimicrobium terrae]NNC32789.1 type II toxin-antitoxin system HicA family toxin [Longimicrobium terrae]
MTRLPRPTAPEVIRVLNELGFEVVRIKGSHHFLRHADGRATVVPVHAGDVIGPGLMSKILRDADVTRDAFLDRLQG